MVRKTQKRRLSYYASQSGLRSRSTFKLQQIQSKFKLFSKMDIVVELGVAPGGWSAYLVDQGRCVVGCITPHCFVQDYHSFRVTLLMSRFKKLMIY